MTIFVSILRDPKNPDNKDDLHSLNMAATFFATLIPGDRPCTYARFMTRMCANFERIARMVLDREQRALKPGEKGHSVCPSRFSNRAMSTSAKSHDDEQSSSSSSPQVHPSALNGVHIPNLEGLPRINSSGYVVPDSPSDALDTDANIPLNTSIPQPSSHPHTPSNPQPTSTSAPRSQPPRPANTTSLENINMLPFSISDNLAPDLWQIPLTADWELGNQFWGGFFGQNFAAPGTGPAEPSAPGNPAAGPAPENMPHSPPGVNLGFGLPVGVGPGGGGVGGGNLPFGAPAQAMWNYGPFFDPF